MSLLFNYLMLPILFILHDFEEMIIVPDWKQRRKVREYPKNFFGDTTHAPAFSVAVMEEFIILLLVSIICQIFHLPLLYLAFCLAYTSHFFIHYFLCWQFKGYVPGVVTVTLQLPIMITIIAHYWQTSWNALIYFAIVFAIVYANLVIMHRLMARFENFLTDFAQH